MLTQEQKKLLKILAERYTSPFEKSVYPNIRKGLISKICGENPDIKFLEGVLAASYLAGNPSQLEEVRSDASKVNALLKDLSAKTPQVMQVFKIIIADKSCERSILLAAYAFEILYGTDTRPISDILKAEIRASKDEVRASEDNVFANANGHQLAHLFWTKCEGGKNKELFDLLIQRAKELYTNTPSEKWIIECLAAAVPEQKDKDRILGILTAKAERQETGFSRGNHTTTTTTNSSFSPIVLAPVPAPILAATTPTTISSSATTTPTPTYKCSVPQT